YVLRRFLRDLADVGIENHPALPTTLGQEQCIVGDGSKLRNDTNVYLEDLDLAIKDASGQAWAEWLAQRIFANDAKWQDEFAVRFCIVHDDVLNFLLETATEITARIKLQAEAKTVEKGGLWYEESLPTESILSGLVIATPIQKAQISVEEIFAQLAKFNNSTLQVGGKATVGRGLVRLQFHN
ncbi:MAG: type III-B CRISPR module RAMP protein Cmr4, partial [Caldilineaceae bacterium]|nr:type III-B CRISPR module RAMP protein Cmr4 [Caldilineaceae bacterium]